MKLMAVLHFAIEVSCYLREDKDTNKFKAVDIHVKQHSVDFFRGAYATHVANPTYIQHEMRAKEVIPCFDERDVTSMPLGSIYNWVTSTMHAVRQRSMRPQITGELEVINATLEDSGFYRCIVTSSEANIRLVFNRPIIVYGIPEYYLLRYMTFRSNRKDKKLAEQIYAMVRQSFCRGSHIGCLFVFRDKGFETKLGFHYYTMEMKQILDPHFHLPKCNPACIKQSALNYMAFGDIRTQAFQHFRWKTVEKIKSTTKFIFEGGEDTFQIYGWCRDGFFLWREQICLPCLPGTYGWKRSCWKCGLMSYQPHFASKSCRKCPRLGFSLDFGKSDADECIPFSNNRLGKALFISLAFLVFLILWIFSLHCGLMPCIYRPDRNKGRLTYKDQQYLNTLETHIHKTRQIKQLLKKAKTVEKKLIKNYGTQKIHINDQNRKLLNLKAAKKFSNIE